MTFSAEGGLCLTSFFRKLVNATKIHPVNPINPVEYAFRILCWNPTAHIAGQPPQALSPGTEKLGEL
jgi:hypothetical protein